MIALSERADGDVYSRECLEQMEAALLEYVQRYGLTGAAREALTALARLEPGPDGRDEQRQVPARPSEGPARAR